MNPLIQGNSGTTPVMSRNAFSTNKGTNEDDAQSDPHPEAGVFGNQTMRKSGPTDRRDMVTGVERESFCGRDMVTGVTEQTRNGHYMVTGATERHYMVRGATERHDMVTGVQRESLCGRDMVRGVQRESLCQRDLVTRAHKEVTYCSPSISSGKQKKNRPTSQPQIRSENTPATIKTDQILLALQQLANNYNFENFHDKINKICN